MSEAQYPEDEFDRIGKRLPQGAHRPGQPWWHGFLPFVIAVIAAPLVAWALLLLINSHPADSGTAETPPKEDKSTNQSAASGAAETPHETETGKETPLSSSGAPEETTNRETAEVTPTTKSTPEKTIDKSSPISVFNASGINGLAAKTKQKIVTKGYTKVTADNFTGTKPRQNTIYFSAEHAAEAKEIQQVLQIDMIVERSNVTGVRVVLVKNL